MNRYKEANDRLVVPKELTDSLPKQKQTRDMYGSFQWRLF